MTQQLIQTIDSQNEKRLENIFNFAWGSDKGLSFSGSAFYSKSDVKEKIAMLGSQDKLDMEVEDMGVGINLGYIW